MALCLGCHCLVTQVKALWERRERIAEALVRDGVTYKVCIHTHLIIVYVINVDLDSETGQF